MQKEVRKTSKAKGSEAQLALYDKRTKLQKEIDQFHQSSLLYLPPLDPATITHKDPNDWVDEEEENEGESPPDQDDGSEEAVLSAPGQDKGPELKVEVPPPPSPAKEKDVRESVLTPDEEVGETEEISLN